MLRIIHYPHPALRYKSRPVERIDDALRAQVREMFALMYEARGIGLAANQVALPYRFFILNLTADPAQADQEQVFINPQILKRHASLEEEEGCLSLPGLYAPVHRAKRVRVRAFTLSGEMYELEAEDLLSRAIQHELDHLDGTLFIDHLAGKARTQVAAKLKEFEDQFQAARVAGEIPDDEGLKRQLEAMARGEMSTCR